MFLRLIQILTGIEFVSIFLKSGLLNQLLLKGICSSLEGVVADINCQLDGIYEQYRRHVSLCGCFQRGISKQEMVIFKVGDLPQCLVKIDFQRKCVLYLPPLLPKHLYLCAVLICCPASSVFQAELHTGGPLRDLQPQTGTAKASSFKDQAATGSSNSALQAAIIELLRLC